MTLKNSNENSLQRLLGIMQRLRDPETGCSWDQKQTQKSLLPYTLEEAYEVADAIECGDDKALQDELGDLLYQIVFYAQIADESGRYNFFDIAETIGDKLIRRHPHVFGKSPPVSWEAIKQAERSLKRDPSTENSVLDGIAMALPASDRAEKLQQRAARVGFDWPNIDGVLAKVAEELAECRHALSSGDLAAYQEELGDLLFTCINLIRFSEYRTESILRQANSKFERRFRQMEQLAANQGLVLADLPAAAQEDLWNQVKG